MTSTFRTRVMGPKSSNGCLVCRKRRIKCDETRPQCSRCQKGRFKCDFGHTTDANKSTLKIINYAAPPSRPLASIPDGKIDELRALDYFRNCAAPDLGGVCSGELWTRFLLPAAFRHAAVRHALVALGTAHESFTQLHSLPHNIDGFALHQYGRAMSEVAQLDGLKRSDAMDITLATNIIFASLETVRGYPRMALYHVQAGLKILDEELQHPTNQQRAHIPRHLICDGLERLDFQVIEMGAKDLGRRPSKPDATIFTFNGNFKTSQEALQTVQVCHNNIQRFFRWADSVIPGGTPSLEIVNGVLDGFDSVKALHIQLKQAVAAFIQNNVDHPESIDPKLLILKNMETGYDILLNMDRNKHDCAYDVFINEFQTIVDCAETYLQLSSTPLKASSTAKNDTSHCKEPSPSLYSTSDFTINHFTPTTEKDIFPKPETYLTPSFSLSSGILPSLYFTASRCRNPTLRRKALRLLRICNRREGIWDSRVTAQIVARLIELEEASALQQLRARFGKRAPKVIDSVHQVPLSARAGVLGLRFGVERQAKVVYVMSDPATGYSTKKVVVEDISW